jgi:hypothetical protein
MGRYALGRVHVSGEQVFESEPTQDSLQSHYLTISDDNLVRAIDMMRFDVGDTEIWVKK